MIMSEQPEEGNFVPTANAKLWDDFSVFVCVCCAYLQVIMLRPLYAWASVSSTVLL